MFLLASLFLFTSNITAAEVPIWSHGFGDGEQDYYAPSLQETTDRGLIVAGRSTFWAGTFHDSALLLRLNNSGDVVWAVDGGSYEDNWFNWAEQTSDGGFVAAGRGIGGWFVKLNGDGELEWQKFYGSDVYGYFAVVHQVPDGGYIMAGTRYSADVGQNSIWLVRIDSQGNILWQKMFDSANESSIVRSMQRTSDGGFILAGDRWIFKTDSLGNIVWQKSSNNGAFLKSVIQTSEGGYLAVGHHAAEGGGWLLKLDPNGVVEWQKELGVGSWVIWSIQGTQDGGYILSESGRKQANSTYEQLIVKTNASGIPVWIKSFKRSGIVIAMSDGGYAVLGTETSYLSDYYDASFDLPFHQINQPLTPTEGTGGQNILIMKLDENGSASSICEKDSALRYKDATHVLEDASFSVVDVSVEPVPATITLQRFESWAPEEHVFCENFDDDILSSEWSYIGRSWIESHGTLISNSSGRRSSRAILNSLQHRKVSAVYAVSAQMESAGGNNNSLSLVAWRLNNRNYVEFVMDQSYDTLTLRRVVNGQVVDEVSRTTSKIYSNIPYDAVMRIVDDASGRRVEAVFDGRVRVHFPIADDFSVTGKIGFRVKRTTGTFRSLRIFGNKN